MNKRQREVLALYDRLLGRDDDTLGAIADIAVSLPGWSWVRGMTMRRVSDGSNDPSRLKAPDTIVYWSACGWPGAVVMVERFGFNDRATPVSVSAGDMAGMRPELSSYPTGWLMHSLARYGAPMVVLPNPGVAAVVAALGVGRWGQPVPKDVL